MNQGFLNHEFIKQERTSTLEVQHVLTRRSETDRRVCLNRQTRSTMRPPISAVSLDRCWRNCEATVQQTFGQLSIPQLSRFFPWTLKGEQRPVHAPLSSRSEWLQYPRRLIEAGKPTPSEPRVKHDCSQGHQKIFIYRYIIKPHPSHQERFLHSMEFHARHWFFYCYPFDYGWVKRP